MPKEPRRLRVYEQWQGNERFFCWGHCVTGPSWKSGLGTLVLLIAPTIVFLVFTAPYMSEKVTPAIMVVSCVLPVICMTMLFLTSCKDPGILPRQEPDEEWLQGRKPRAKDVAVNGHRVTVRYNDTCHFYQPPRAHHCSVNDNCIERFDHHCPWVGTTIGKRNYRTFLMFIYSTSLYIAWTFGVCMGSLFVKHKELEQAAAGANQGESLASNLWLQTLSQSGAAIAVMIFTFIFFWFVCGLSGFHTWLVATNQTTYENFRYNHNQVPNPYNEGIFRNCASVWCLPIPPSKVQFRAYADEVQRVPVELGYPEWGAAAVSPQRGGMSEADGVAIEMQGVNNHQQQGAVGLQHAGLSRDAAPPMQSFDSSIDDSAQAPVGRVNGHKILGAGGAQLQMNTMQDRASWQTASSASVGSGYGITTAATAAKNAYDEEQHQHSISIGSPVAGDAGMEGYNGDLQSAKPVGSLANTVQAMRAATAAGVSNAQSGIAPEDLEIQVPTSPGLSSSSKQHL